MNEELHRHLDGEISLDRLDGGKRREAEAWDRLLEAFRAENPPAPAPPWLEDRVMAEIEALPEPGALRRVARWLLLPHPVRVSPLTVGLAAAALAAVLLLGWHPPGFLPGFGDPGQVDGVVFVQFALEAPGATSVAVAGDFDEWKGAFPLEDLNGDGVWSGRVPIRPGVHAYMFLVDGSTWLTDPRAERYAEDGFGNRNAILAVAAPST